MAPVTALESLIFRNSNTQGFFDECRQTNLAYPSETSDDTCVVQAVDPQPVMPVKGANVVVSTVDHFLDGLIRQNFSQGCELW